MNFLIFFVTYTFLLAHCLDTKTSQFDSLINKRAIWWRYNSFYNEAYLKMLKRKLELVNRVKEKLLKRRNEILIEKLINQAKNTLFNQILNNIKN
jgi:hypothetical protein